MKITQYGIEVAERNLDLIQFLNDGVRVEVPKKRSYFIFSIHGENASEITAKVHTEDELYDLKGYLRKDIALLY